MKLREMLACHAPLARTWLERDLKAIETGYWENMLHLTLARAYVRKLLNNSAVAGFLSAGFAEIFAEFTAVAATESL